MISGIKLLRLWYFLATGFGLGKLFNIVPVGTIASLIAIPMWWILVYLYSYQGYYIFLIFSIGIGIYCCGKVNKLIGINDHKSIVWDEFIGMWITLIIVPIYDLLLITFSFLLFRIFDILKPWPISWFDQTIRNGFGIIIDDILAGLLSICVILFFMKYFPNLLES